MNTIAFLGDEKMSKVGVNKRGLILYGLPGTGKSSACRAIFTELEGRGVSRVYVTSESFRRMSAQSLFSFLPFLGKTVIAFEDIDLLGGNRDNMISVNTSLLGDLLTNLDGMRNYDEKIVILASTNKMSLLDDALSRPGRFDRKIEIGLPTEANLKVLYRKFSDLDASDELIKLSKDFTGSHVRETVNTAKILALSEGKGVAECLQEACQIIRDNFFVGQTMSETKTASLTKVSNIIKSRKIVGKKKLSSDKIAEEFIKVMGEEKVREMYKENNV
jgi:ATP-dependent 26S proteasome regulatory subunit